MEWRQQLHISDTLDAQNVFGIWCPAMILHIVNQEVHVRFLNMDDSWAKWFPIDSGQLAPEASKTLPGCMPLRREQVVAVRKADSMLWREAVVEDMRAVDIRVHYRSGLTEWLPFTPLLVAPAEEHLSYRNYSAQRQLSVNQSPETRSRVIQAQNPRFQHYRDTLLAHNLRLHPVEGDGNCLFRAVSHQVYGNDGHHGLVRRYCMDYMESEKDYFEPYIVGDMNDFMRYVTVKRRDGVWGDDPEIQAMCELYDRPAEIYAYDPVSGYRKLRTFHEHGARSRNRPPIRLSYYGGGHYDSIVGANHQTNLITEAPGVWEQRHIEYSRRMSLRRGGDGLEDAEAQSDRESTEMAQLEHILIESRSEFDAMNSNLEDTLKLSLQDGPHNAPESEQEALAEAQRISEMTAIQAELIEKAKQVSEEEEMKKAIAASLSEPHPSDVFEDDISAAIQASLAATHSAHDADSEEEEMRRALELSVQEYRSPVFDPLTVSGMDDITDADQLDELQRAIQASLQQP
ncbi:TPA: hypothetical protein N0F65_002292 [Lagenidium giganteum]|uniref:ubiquitinyl hydrolase 1 n=1 Tax=Lagenidium giganteum TaxID=4803 RepID=A0AAV2Z631_9STRA|nr:TPA: hypothetical protein N0F65_002292 [Lagenidium giganteum]